MRELPFYTNWTYAHPRAVELAAEVASLAPGDLNRVFFVSGGSEAVESAWKLARQYYLARGEQAAARAAGPGPGDATTTRSSRPRDPDPPLQGDRAAHRLPRDDVRGALAQRDPRDPRARSSRSSPRCGTSATRTATTARRGDGGGVHRSSCSTTSSRRSRRWGRRRSASSTWSPCRTPAASFIAPEGYWQGVRELCTEYDILLSADEVITGFGRLGHWFALRALRHPAGHRSPRRRGSRPRTRRSAP